MTALPSATRPLTRLAQSSLIIRSNALQSICYRCQALALKDSPAQLFVAAQSQRRYINIRWGSKEHVPGVKVRKGKRQRLIEAGKNDSMGAPQMTTSELRDTYAPELFVFRSDVASGNITAAMQSLTNLVELDILRPNDSSNLAQAIHEAFRSKSLPKQTLIEYLRVLSEHLQAGRLPKHYIAHVHIISTLKEMEEWNLGNEYWNWLKGKNLEHLNGQVFGAVIEFLAYQGAPLQELEKTYSLALEAFSKSEDAGGGMQHRATSVMLVQGIVTARILNDDWRGAYEALDQISRLHPTQVPRRVYELFILNRPTREGYLVFLMACRAGTKLSPKTLVWIMGNWWKMSMDVKGILQLVLAHLAIGGKPRVEILNKIIFGLLGRLPEAPEPPAPLGSLIKTELEQIDERTVEEKEKEEREWKEWDKKMEEYQSAVNPMFGTIRRIIDLFDGVNVEPDIVTYCNIISQAARRHLRQIVAAAMREIDAKVRSGKGTMEESFHRVLLGACGSLADQEGVKKAWEDLVEWRKRYLKATMKGDYRPGTAFTGKSKAGDRDHELISWKALIRAGFEAGMKPYILEQLNKYQGQFGDRLTADIRLELVRREGSLQKSLKEDAEMLAAAVKSGEDSIDTTSNLATIARKPKLIISTTVPDTSYADLRAEVPVYNQVLDVMEQVIRSTVAYDFSMLDFDLKPLGLPETTEDDIRQLKEVYEHFQANMPRSPFLTATHDPKTDLAGLERMKDKKEDEGQNSGSWGEGRSVTGYSINQLRFENWVSINRLLYLAEKGPEWNEKNGGGDKGFKSGYRRREVHAAARRKDARAKDAMDRVAGLEGRKWEEETLALRASLIGNGPVLEEATENGQVDQVEQVEQVEKV